MSLHINRIWNTYFAMSYEYCVLITVFIVQVLEVTVCHSEERSRCLPIYPRNVFGISSGKMLNVLCNPSWNEGNEVKLEKREDAIKEEHNNRDLNSSGVKRITSRCVLTKRHKMMPHDSFLSPMKPKKLMTEDMMKVDSKEDAGSDSSNECSMESKDSDDDKKFEEKCGLSHADISRIQEKVETLSRKEPNLGSDCPSFPAQPNILSKEKEIFPKQCTSKADLIRDQYKTLDDKEYKKIFDKDYTSLRKDLRNDTNSSSRYDKEQFDENQKSAVSSLSSSESLSSSGENRKAPEVILHPVNFMSPVSQHETADHDPRMHDSGVRDEPISHPEIFGSSSSRGREFINQGHLSSGVHDQTLLHPDAESIPRVENHEVLQNPHISYSETHEEKDLQPNSDSSESESGEMLHPGEAPSSGSQEEPLVNSDIEISDSKNQEILHPVRFSSSGMRDDTIIRPDIHSVEHLKEGFWVSPGVASNQGDLSFEQDMHSGNDMNLLKRKVTNHTTAR